MEKRKSFSVNSGSFSAYCKNYFKGKKSKAVKIFCFYGFGFFYCFTLKLIRLYRMNKFDWYIINRKNFKGDFPIDCQLFWMIADGRKS